MTANRKLSTRRVGGTAVALTTALLLALTCAPMASADKTKIHFCNTFPPCGQGAGNHLGQFKNPH